MQPTSDHFKANAAAALHDAGLQRALDTVRSGFHASRQRAVDRLPEFEALREQGKAIKDHVLAHLDWYLEHYEAKVRAAGGHVHWARTPAEACQIVLDIAGKLGARTATKGKSMIAEEIALNDFLAANGVEPIETDLGEYIIQLRNEPPSHIIAPAIHLTRSDIEQTFRQSHPHLDRTRNLDE